MRAVPPVLVLLLGLPGLGWGLPGEARTALLDHPEHPIPREAIVRSWHEDLDAKFDRGLSHPVDTPEGLRMAAQYRRFLTHTDHPDERYVLMALARMSRRETPLDTGTLQYGPLYVGGVGAAVWIAWGVGFVDPVRDPIVYVEEPDRMGRLFLVGRLVSLAAAVVLVLVVGRFGRRAFGEPAGTIAACLVAMSPAVVNWAHIAKPHLPASVLLLLAFLLALRYARGGAARLGWWSEFAVAASIGMVLSAPWALGIGPIAALCRRGEPIAVRLRAAVLLGLVGGGVAALLHVHSLIAFERSAAELAFWKRAWWTGGGGLADLLPLPALFGTLAGPVVLLLGCAGGIWIFGRRDADLWALLGLLVAGTVWTTFQNNPRVWEDALNGRFLLVWVPMLALAAAVPLGAAWQAGGRWRAAAALLLLVEFVGGARIALGYDLGASADAPRHRAGEWIRENIPAGGGIDLRRVPGGEELPTTAPYELPPFPFGRYRLLATDAGADWRVEVLRDREPPIPPGWRQAARFDPVRFGIDLTERMSFAAASVRILAREDSE